MTTQVRIQHRGGNRKIKVFEAYKDPVEKNPQPAVTILENLGEEHVVYVHGDNRIVIEEE